MGEALKDWFKTRSAELKKTRLPHMVDCSECGERIDRYAWDTGVTSKVRKKVEITFQCGKCATKIWNGQFCRPQRVSDLLARGVRA